MDLKTYHMRENKVKVISKLVFYSKSMTFFGFYIIFIFLQCNLIIRVLFFFFFDKLQYI